MHREAAEAIFRAHTQGISEHLMALRGWQLFGRDYPILDVGFSAPGRTSLRLRLMCDDWNDAPPSIILLTLGGGPIAQVPQGGGSVFHQGPHPQTGKPFICMAGSYEYHIHPNHTSDNWSNYKTRSGYDLGGIVTQIWNAWKKTIQ